ncbi:CooT family nickel-binding protein [Desulforhopalus sp. IMCC35007]|uniref:CooT family nickel-binding protein n=1 Tax=Desulforhopalus sp. IMCC35007 TaxID=2569543 RepID=UPI0010AE09F4|nr:CooT family nickel-binding protein [Desulforhopalus sp. IMCC35007]TKB07958.1 CooT family nickel-binding protein [Desulforhopalus sp. IMCC35007]
MCQTSVVMEKEGQEELLHENVTALEVNGKNITITTLFEGATEHPNVAIRRINFSGGKVYLQQIA